MEKGFNRAEYLLWMLGLKILMELTYAWIPMSSGLDGVIFLVGIIAMLWVTSIRCIDIGINGAHCFWAIIPVVWLYFLFKRGKAYREKQERKAA